MREITKYLFVAVLTHVLVVSAWAQNDILDHKDNILIQKIHAVNSTARETNLSISPDGKYLYFMSDRGGQIWSGYSGTYNGRPRYDGDIWYSTKAGDKWRPPVCLGIGVNTSSGEDEPMISQDGQYVVYQSWKYNWKVTGGPYYQAELKGGKFTNSRGLGGGISKFILTQYIRSGNTYATDGAAMSPDGKTFLLCCGPRYDGNLDIYISRKKNGVWSYMKKLEISTPGDERSVFIAGDGKTVYFASDGYMGYGGLDVYKTTLNDDGTCGEVVNIGAPFNTTKDDYGFITTASGNESYFVREGDVYSANTQKADPRLKPGNTVIISGSVKNQKGEALEVHLELKDGKTGASISTSKSDSRNGEFLFSTSDVSGSYRIGDLDKMKIDTTFSIDIDKNILEIQIDIIIDDGSANSSTTESIMVNFEHDRAILDEKDRAQLDDIVTKAKGAKTYEIEIIGHTDVHGSIEYNKKLGRERASSMRDYLVQNGLDSDLIKVSSDGESNLIELNQKSPAAERNRRAELTIVYSN